MRTRGAAQIGKQGLRLLDSIDRAVAVDRNKHVGEQECLSIKQPSLVAT
jgi:hypothetical protein